MKYRADIDGLRAVAVLSVVIYHAFPHFLTGGFIGVDVFFVISGYLITRIIFEEEKENKFTFYDFYCRRIKRIFPALILVLSTSLVFGWFALFGDEYRQLSKHVLGGAGFFLNFTLVSEAGYFDNVAITKPMLHLWSLAVEEQFYIIWPLVLWFIWKCNFNLILLIMTIIFTSFSINILLSELKPIDNFFFPIGRFWELLIGSVLAYIFVYKPLILERLKAYLSVFFAATFQFKLDFKILSHFISVFGVLLLLVGIAYIHDGLKYPGYWALLPVFGASLIIASGSNALANRLLLSNPIMIWFGLISYPLYLWHWPIFSFLQIIDGDAPSFDTKIYALLFSILLAWLTYKLIELPVRSIKSTYFILLLILIMTFLACVSFWVYNNDGLPNRKSIYTYQLNKNELLRTPASESDCENFLNLSDRKFNYCRVKDINSKKTVAVIGDSHAHVAYPGIAEGLSKKGFNTVLLANSSCPPLLGAPWGRSEKQKIECNSRIQQILSYVSIRDDIKLILFFSRGPIYWTGSEPSSSKARSPSLDIYHFRLGMQNTVNFFSKSGKKLIYISENPELHVDSKSCLSRPFNQVSDDKCSQSKISVLDRQGDYLKILREIDGLDYLNSLSVFCAGNDVCSAKNVDKGLLYADDDHLSVLGSKEQYLKLIEPYLIRNGFF